MNAQNDRIKCWSEIRPRNYGENAAAVMIAANLLLAWLSVANGQTSPITTGTVSVTLTKVATVNTATFGTPEDIATAPGDNSDLFITTRNGDVLTLNNGTISSTPLLNMAA